jgi:hypothetical protein
MLPQFTGCRRKKSDGEWFSQALNGRFLQLALISSVSPQKRGRTTFHPIYHIYHVPDMMKLTGFKSKDIFYKYVVNAEIERNSR